MTTPLPRIEADVEGSGEQWLRKYEQGDLLAARNPWGTSNGLVFGSNLSRMRTLKRGYDPANVFRHNSNVDPGQA